MLDEEVSVSAFVETWGAPRVGLKGAEDGSGSLRGTHVVIREEEAIAVVHVVVPRVLMDLEESAQGRKELQAGSLARRHIRVGRVEVEKVRRSLGRPSFPEHVRPAP